MNRVLVIGPFGPGQLPLSLAHACERLGLSVARFDSDRAYLTMRGASSRVMRRLLRPMLWRRVNQDTVAAVRHVRPDLVLVVKGAYLDPETIRRIRRVLGVPIANYYPDHPYCGVPWNPSKPSAQRTDLIDALREYTGVWVWERSLARRLARDGVTARYLPFGVDPDCAPPRRGERRAPATMGHGVVFIGQHSVKRQAHLARVTQPVSLWGSRWHRAARAFRGRHVVHPAPVFGGAAGAIYATAAVSLNVLDDLNMPGHNMRTFEIPASGGLMVSTFTAEQAEFFPEGEAAMYYRDPSEIGDRIDCAVRDRALNARLRLRARQIATGHTYDARMFAVLKELRS